MDAEATPESGIFSDVVTDTLKSPDWERIIILFHRLFEAHFLPVQMTILVVASTLYMWATDGTPDVHGVNWIFTVCNVLRTAGFMEVAFYLFLYEGFPPVSQPEGDPELVVPGAKLWRLSETEAIEEAFRDRQLLIADGHHRYETTVEYARTGGSPWLLAVLVSTSDPGVTIFPTSSPDAAWDTAAPVRSNTMPA